MVDEAFTSVSHSYSPLRPGPLAARIGGQVRSWRLEKGLSAAELASALQAPVDMITAAENGDPCFSAEQIVTICQTFGVSPSRFLDSVL